MADKSHKTVWDQVKYQYRQATELWKEVLTSQGDFSKCLYTITQIFKIHFKPSLWLLINAVLFSQAKLCLKEIQYSSVWWTMEWPILLRKAIFCFCIISCMLFVRILFKFEVSICQQEIWQNIVKHSIIFSWCVEHIFVVCTGVKGLLCNCRQVNPRLFGLYRNLYTLNREVLNSLPSEEWGPACIKKHILDQETSTAHQVILRSHISNFCRKPAMPQAAQGPRCGFWYRQWFL